MRISEKIDWMFWWIHWLFSFLLCLCITHDHLHLPRLSSLLLPLDISSSRVSQSLPHARTRFTVSGPASNEFLLPLICPSLLPFGLAAGKKKGKGRCLDRGNERTRGKVAEPDEGCKEEGRCPAVAPFMSVGSAKSNMPRDAIGCVAEVKARDKKMKSRCFRNRRPSEMDKFLAWLDLILKVQNFNCSVYNPRLSLST